MELHEQTDIGEGMKYCTEHKCWYQFGDHCAKCALENIRECVRIEKAAESRKVEG